MSELSDLQAATSRRVNAFTSSPLTRLLVLGLLMLLMLIPLAMIEGTVRERAGRRNDAVAEVTAKTGGAVAVAGPVLRLVCVDRWRERAANGYEIDRETQTAIAVLPQTLRNTVRMSNEVRRRGIFEVPVYTVALRIEGRFAAASLEQCPPGTDEIDWKATQVALGLSSVRTLRADAALVWGGQRLAFEPSTGGAATLLPSGIHVPLAAAAGAGAGAAAEVPATDFSVELGLSGAEQFSIAPMGMESTATLSSDWPHPSFQGAWLPSAREVRADGFDASWSVSWLGRDYPQVLPLAEGSTWREAVERSYFGVSLNTPVDHYRMAERIAKYAVLAVLFTFATVWLTEVLSRRRVHVVQYLLTGAALCLFGLLQLALAEHTGFHFAFAAAAISVVTLVTLYSRSTLGSTRRALGVGGLLAALYGYLYAILQAEDYALLGGALALFAGLALVMWLTRRVDWFGGAAAPAAAPRPATRSPAT